MSNVKRKDSKGRNLRLGESQDVYKRQIPTSSTVTDVLIWDVVQSGENAFTVTYEVDQQIKEGDQTRNV